MTDCTPIFVKNPLVARASSLISVALIAVDITCEILDGVALRCKLFHSIRHFLDNYLTYITICLPKVKVFESACEALSIVVERAKQCRHYVR